MDRFQLMQTFVRVAETGSVSAAARDLGLGQPAVSKHLQMLESSLRSRLLHRSPSGVKLTERGRRYYDRARRLVESIGELESDFRDESTGLLRGLLRVRIPVAFGALYLSDLLARFVREHPALELDLQLSDQPQDLIEQGVDVSVVLGPLADSSLIARKLVVVPRVLVASPAWLRSLPDQIERPEQLAAVSFVRANGPRGPDSIELQDESGQRHSLRVSGRIGVNSGLALRSMLLAGLGAACLPAALVQTELADGLLQRILPDFTPEPVELFALYPSARFLPSKVRALVHFLQAELVQVPGLA